MPEHERERVIHDDGLLGRSPLGRLLRRPDEEVER